MILFTILLLALLLFTVGAIIAIGTGGIAFILVFGDMLICIWLIIIVIKCLTKKKR